MSFPVMAIVTALIQAAVPAPPAPPAPPEPTAAPAAPTPPNPPPARIEWVIGVNSNSSPSDSVWFNWSYEDGSGDLKRTGSARAYPDVRGLTAAAVASAGANVQFAITSDAGALQCAGKVARQKGRGSCNHTPDPAFADEMEKLGVRRPTAGEQTQMMLHGVRLADVAELKRLGYRRLDFHTLMAMRVYNLTPADVVRGSIWLPK